MRTTRSPSSLCTVMIRKTELRQVAEEANILQQATGGVFATRQIRPSRHMRYH